MRFLIDMPVSPLIIGWLREEGHDAVHAAYVGLSRASDEEIITRAQREDRVIVTADLDYTRLLALAGSRGLGIILFRAGNYSNKEMLELMKRVLTTVSTEQLLDSIVVVDKKSIRRRQLPIE